MEDIRNLEDILLILKKQDEMLKMLEEQQDEIDGLEQQISELTQELSRTREHLDESMSLNEDLANENLRLTDFLKASKLQNQKLQLQINSVKNYLGR